MCFLIKESNFVLKYSYLFKGGQRDRDRDRESSVVQQRGAFCCGGSARPVALREGQDV